MKPALKFFENVAEVLSVSRDGLVVLCLGNADRGSWLGKNLGEGHLRQLFRDEVYPYLCEMLEDNTVAAIGLGNSWTGLFNIDMGWGSALVYELRAIGIAFRRGVAVFQEGELVASEENPGWLSEGPSDYGRSVEACFERIIAQQTEEAHAASQQPEETNAGRPEPYDFADDDGDEGDPQGQEHIEAFHILGLPATASFDEVRSAFRRLSKQFHPDVIAGKDLNPEFTAFAERRFKEIRTAYEVLRTGFERA